MILQRVMSKKSLSCLTTLSGGQDAGRVPPTDHLEKSILGPQLPLRGYPKIIFPFGPPFQLTLTQHLNKIVGFMHL